ncbi:MAG: hypothetical protein WDN45_05540 [Caulobacteraceae bacterium]
MTGGSALAAACLLGGCVVGPDYRAPQTAALAVPEAYSVSTAPAAPVDLAAWWRQLDDPLLTDLIGRATAGQSRHRRLPGPAGAGPRIPDPGPLNPAADPRRVRRRQPHPPPGRPGPPLPSAARRSSREAIPSLSQLSLGLDASWQADIFGGNRRSVEAAQANADAAVFSLAGVRTSVGRRSGNQLHPGPPGPRPGWPSPATP